MRFIITFKILTKYKYKIIYVFVSVNGRRCPFRTLLPLFHHERQNFATPESNASGLEKAVWASGFHVHATEKPRAKAYLKTQLYPSHSAINTRFPGARSSRKGKNTSSPKKTTGSFEIYKQPQPDPIHHSIKLKNYRTFESKK